MTESGAKGKEKGMRAEGLRGQMCAVVIAMTAQLRRLRHREGK